MKKILFLIHLFVGANCTFRFDQLIVNSADLSKAASIVYKSTKNIQASVDQFSKEHMADDCSVLHNLGLNVSTSYWLRKYNKEVFCDMQTAGGGWLVVQQRRKVTKPNQQVNFKRNWASYKEGFGDLNTEFWIGNEFLHQVTSHQSYELRIDVEDFQNGPFYATYSIFQVGNEKSGYKLRVGGYEGNATDGLSNHNNMKFTTFDRDNDLSKKNCASKYSGAFWHKDCYSVHLNGVFPTDPDRENDNLIRWWYKGAFQVLDNVEVKIRPKKYEVEVRAVPTDPPHIKECGVNTKKSSFKRIIKGKPVHPKDWPWMAALLWAGNKTLRCGGTLITDSHVLTAAHCSVGLTARAMIVRLGIFIISPGENNPTDFRIAEIREHENYNDKTYENDIAILKLGSPATFGEFILPACLPPPDIDLVGQEGYVIGWGKTESGHLSKVLREVEIPVWKQDECKTAYPDKVYDFMMCAGYEAGGKDSCQGDSGGPFLVQIFPETRWYVAGVVSWGKGCAKQNLPGVYTRVNKYLDWIEENSVYVRDPYDILNPYL